MYKVEVNDGVCPAIFSDEISIILNSVDVQHSIHNIGLYPNPTSGELYLNNVSQYRKIAVYEIIGKKLLDSPVVEKIDVTALSAGIYLLEVIDKEGRIIVLRFEKK